MRAPTHITVMLFDSKGQRPQIELLDDVWRLCGCFQAVATIRAMGQAMRDRSGYLLRWKGLAKMRWVTRVATDRAFGSIRIRRWLGRLDNIGGRRLGRRGGIFACFGQLFFQLPDCLCGVSVCLLQLCETRLHLLQSLLQF